MVAAHNLHIQHVVTFVKWRASCSPHALLEVGRLTQIGGWQVRKNRLHRLRQIQWQWRTSASIRHEPKRVRFPRKPKRLFNIENQEPKWPANAIKGSVLVGFECKIRTARKPIFHPRP